MLLRELVFEENCEDAEVNHILFIPRSLNAEAGVLEISILLVRNLGDIGTFALIVSVHSLVRNGRMVSVIS